MWFSSWKRTWKRSVSEASRRSQTYSRQRDPIRPRLEVLEDRWLPTNYTAGSVSDLIYDINAANQSGGTNTITLTANYTFGLTAVNNSTNGANGLPVISGGGKKVAANNLTINGLGGDIIERDSAAPHFRLFDVASGGSLTLQNVTLQGGSAFGSGAAAAGGAIYNQGTLTLINTVVQNNTAQGSNGAAAWTVKNSKQQLSAAQLGADAAGGGIWTNGTVKLQGGTLIGSTDGYYPFYSNGNRAIGGGGGNGGYSSQRANGGAGGGGFGGGLYQAGGSVTVSNATLAGNLAVGGVGGMEYFRNGISGNGGNASGGGLYIASGTLAMNNDSVKTNWAMAGSGGQFSGWSKAYGGTGGTGSGGGIYVGGGAVTLKAINLSSNSAEGGNGGEHSQDVLLTSAALVAEHGYGGSGLGGGLFVGGGTVTLTGDTVANNVSAAGVSGYFGIPNGSPGVAGGGGIYIASGATASLDSSTVSNTTNNLDYSGYGLSLTHKEDDIDGSFALI